MTTGDERDQPTLADLIIRRSNSAMARRNEPSNFMGRTVAAARKFVLDDQMSEFMADLANAALPRTPPRLKWSKVESGTALRPRRNKKRDTAILEGMRIQARLPYPVMWLEFNMRARLKRAMDAYGATTIFPISDTPERSGWLLLQHPQVKTAFMAIECSSPGAKPYENTLGYDFADEFSGREIRQKPNSAYVAFTWTVDDAIPPWPRLPADSSRPAEYLLEAESKGLGLGNNAATMLSGVVYQSPHVEWAFVPYFKGLSAAKRRKFEQPDIVDREKWEQHGALRYLWGLLSALNDTPIGYRRVRPTSHHMVGSNFRRFMDHTVITLNVPHKTRLTALARKIQRAARRRAHDVRGHHRKDFRFPLAPFCEHDFEVVSDTHLLRCKHCHGRKVWIDPHQRGDASLGYVLHDYTVHHPTES